MDARRTVGPRAAALAFIMLLAPQAPAQEAGSEAGEADAPAVLVSGPVRRQSLPFLPPNAIEYQRGVYELPGGTAPEATVEVFYTEAPVFRRGTWTETSCDGRTVHALPEAGGTLVHYTWPREQRHAFFRFARPGDGAPGNGAAADGADATANGDAPPGAGDAGAPVARTRCDFIEAFLERFSFFLDTTESGGAAPFPAVLPR